MGFWEHIMGVRAVGVRKGRPARAVAGPDVETLLLLREVRRTMADLLAAISNLKVQVNAAVAVIQAGTGNAAAIAQATADVNDAAGKLAAAVAALSAPPAPVTDAAAGAGT